MSRNASNRTKKLIEVLGPVDNLESYVKADWWRHLFNANYLRTDGDVVEDEDVTNHEVDLFLGALDVSQESGILDLCCGQGRHALEIARRGYTNVVGFDRSHYLIDRARKINKASGLNVTFREGDARKLPFRNDSFEAVIIAGNSFGYFESSDDDVRILNEVIRVLQPGGKVLIDLTDGDYMRQNFQPRSWEWIDKNYFVCRERSLSENGERLISREVITHVNKGVIADQFYAERLYSNDDLRNQLKKIGFKQVNNVAKVSAGSKRNQDLGMMAERILVTAVVQKQWSVVRKPSRAKATVAVLMGDPSKTDIVKPDGSFDEDDYHTINELKRALSELSHYNFVYLDQHNTLIQDLQKLRRGDDNRADTQKRVRSIRSQLDKLGWERIVTVQEQNGEDVGIYIKSRADEALEGIVITVLDDRKKEAVFVNIVGDIKPEQIAALGEALNIDPLKKIGGSMKK
jgi:D-alanine-D-alanine ligase